mgnify:CR=1 FL=1
MQTARCAAAPFIATILCLIVAQPAAAQYGAAPRPIPPSDVVTQVRIDQRLGAQVPLDLVFRDESGDPITLRDAAAGKPAILMLVYYACPSLCTVSLNNLTSALKTLSLDAGDEFTIVTVSFDPAETPDLAAAKKATYLRQYGRAGADAGWRFLTGDPEPIAALTDAVGFRYVYDPATGQYAHGSAVIILTPDGVVSRYLFGIEHAPKDLQLALVDSSDRRIGTLVDRALLLCYQYDPTTGRYGLAIMSSLRAGGLLTILAIGAYIGRKILKERAAPAPLPPHAPPPLNDQEASP